MIRLAPQQTIEKSARCDKCMFIFVDRADMPVKCFRDGARLKMEVIDMPCAARNAVAPVGKGIDIQKVHS